VTAAYIRSPQITSIVPDDEQDEAIIRAFADSATPLDARLAAFLTQSAAIRDICGFGHICSMPPPVPSPFPHLRMGQALRCRQRRKGSQLCPSPTALEGRQGDEADPHRASLSAMGVLGRFRPRGWARTSSGATRPLDGGQEGSLIRPDEASGRVRGRRSWPMF
jgi:hypothetical protein